jgi:Fe2+ transport system protein B
VRAVADGLIGLLGIVIPYMIPLVLLLVFLEESGIMHRVAFVVDRGFYQLGLHGGVALPFLMGLGCNVPALATFLAFWLLGRREAFFSVALSVGAVLVVALAVRLPLEILLR